MALRRLSASLTLGKKLSTGFFFFFFFLHLAGFIAMCNGYKGLREATVKAGSAPLSLLDLSEYLSAGFELAKSYCGSI